jgi:hypothetical protein
LVGIVRCVDGVTLAPIIADSVGENVTSFVESSRGDRTADRWVSFESVFGDSIPEVKRDGIDVRHIVLGWVSMTFE